MCNEMRVQDRWIYLNDWTSPDWMRLSVYDDSEEGLIVKSSHNVEDWVDGRVLHNDRAERLKLDYASNQYEVWTE